MSSDYTKQLEEANETLRSRLEQFESRCEWLEKLRLFRATSCWAGDCAYTVGINNYKSPSIGRHDTFYIPDDKNISEVMNYIYDDIIRTYAFSVGDTHKVDVKRRYDDWRLSIASFMSYAKVVFDSSEYTDIHKLSLSTYVHLSLVRLGAESERIEAFDVPLNEKDIMQGVTIVIRRGEQLPVVNVVIRKNINGFHNNVKFMGFEKQVKELKRIYHALEDLKKAEEEFAKKRKEYWDVP